MLVLPGKKRRYFKEPFGELFSEIGTIIPVISHRPVYTVGDIVTYNLKKKGIIPSVAIVDGYTMRLPCTRIPPITGRIVQVENPPGTITDDLVASIADALSNPPATIFVKGEEDLAVIPLVIAAPQGSVVLYGQPGRGVVLRTVDIMAKERANKLLSHFVRAARN